MRFDILSNISAAEQAREDELLKRKYAAKEEQAKAATMRAQAAGVTARTGEMAVEREYESWPASLPTRRAETARISATGYAESARRGAATAEKGLGLEREKFEYSKKFLESASGLPGSPEAEAGEVAKIRKRLSADICPEGFMWDGQQCIPTE